MTTAKGDSERFLAKKIGNASEQEMKRALAFERMVQRGLADSDAGRTLSNTKQVRPGRFMAIVKTVLTQRRTDHKRGHQ